MVHSMMEARLRQPPSAANIDFIVKAELDDELAMYPEAMQVDMAHVVMMDEVGIIDRSDSAAILRELANLERQGLSQLPIDLSRGSLLLQVEHYLSERIGESPAGRLHTGRSRNDVDTAVHRLYTRNRLLRTIEELYKLQDTLLSLAASNLGSYMPGYTHLQYAQPITLAHFFLRYGYIFERDIQRLEGAFSRANLSALGGAALAGTSWPLDRERTAELLGHEGLVENALDTGIFARDYPLESIAALAILMNTLGQLAGDLYLWSTWEFSFIEVADELAGTSSIMPQKKNPHVYERVRGLTGRAIGWVPATMGTLRSTFSSDLDLFWAGDPFQQASEDTHQALGLMQAGLETSRFRTDVMRERAGLNWSTATYLADELVRSLGFPFRTAHSIVGRFVSMISAEGSSQPGTTQHLASVLTEAAREITGEPIRVAPDVIERVTDVKTGVDSLITRGSASAASGAKMIEQLQDLQVQHRHWLDAKQTLLHDARAMLDERIEAISGAASTAAQSTGQQGS